MWVLLAAVAVVSFGCFAYPMYVIRPFRAQGAQELQAALMVARWGFPVAGLCSISALLACWSLWKGSGMATRAGAGLLTVVTLLCAGLTRVNVYEIMFHRIDAPAFTAAGDAKVDGDDMVLAVNMEGAARAYPVRTLTYHHIVNDRLGGAALAATY